MKSTLTDILSNSKTNIYCRDCNTQLYLNDNNKAPLVCPSCGKVVKRADIEETDNGLFEVYSPEMSETIKNKVEDKMHDILISEEDSHGYITGYYNWWKENENWYCEMDFSEEKENEEWEHSVVPSINTIKHCLSPLVGEI